MSKLSLISKVNIVEEDDVAYAIIYVVHGCHRRNPANTIGHYFCKDEAEKSKEFYQSTGIYDVVYIVEKIVWF